MTYSLFQFFLICASMILVGVTFTYVWAERAIKAAREEGYRNAVEHILVFKDKIYTQPLTVVDENLTLTKCSFVKGMALRVADTNQS